MIIRFSKYQGTGNDFIVIDNRNSFFPGHNIQLISQLCDRKFGIGADGLILLENKEDHDFEMVYFNSDGKQSTMCGNGGRCITAFANRIGITTSDYFFSAVDGAHKAKILSADPVAKTVTVSLKMNDVRNIRVNADHFILDTGSPHYVKFVENLDAINIVEESRKIRYSDKFKDKGINVNFVQNNSKSISIRTYERGVEDETLSCGTGMTAAALCASLKNPENENLFYQVKSKGGETLVRFERSEDRYFYNIWLEGPATFIFEGEINI